MHKPLLLLAMVALIVALCGCTPAATGDNSQPPQTGTPTLNPDNLAETSWVLDGYGNPDALTALIENTRISLVFNEVLDGISGNAGCNLYGGSVTIHDSTITLVEIYQTEMACLEPGVMEQEGKYIALLSQAASWRLENGLLTITARDGQALVYSAGESAPEPLSSLAGTNWTLSAFGQGDAVSSLINGTNISLSFNEDATKISGNGGVNSYGGDCRLSGDDIEISGFIQTKMSRNDPPGVMTQEDHFFWLLTLAQRFEATTARLTIYCQSGEFLVFNAA